MQFKSGHLKYYTALLIIFLSVKTFAQDFRDSVDVVHYKIELNVPNFSDKHIDGKTTLTIAPTFDNTKIIKLDLLKLKVTDVLIDDKKPNDWEYKKDIITINLKKEINKKDTIKIEVTYNGNPVEDSDWGGFIFSGIDAFNMGVGMGSVPHSFGRAWFPCIDNFTDKATYEYLITTNFKNKVSCGGVLKKEYQQSKSTTTFNWVQDKPIPTYLASVAIADYDTISYIYQGIERNIPVLIYTYKGKKDVTEKSITNLDSAMKIFENHFGAYSWDKIGYSEVSFSSGAMEHAENISISKYAFNGTLENETLLYHELSHSWFGNLVTCKTAEDMWLNEGWASYCESVYLGNMYGNQKFRDYNRYRHFEVLHLAHLYDKGYRALANMDLTYTYGKTIYDKGADVVHTLRFYLGDSLFFDAVKNYLNEYKFATASTEDLKKSLSNYTGIDLTDFFDFWVYTPGFNYFEIENYSTSQNGNNFDVNVSIKQRLLEANKFANSNKVKVFFMDSNFNTVSRIFEFSGEKATKTFTIPFQPALVMCDLYEEITDATIDKYTFITKPDTYTFDESLCDIDVKNITDTTFLRVTCNVIEPDNQTKNYLFQKNYFWTIEGIWNDDFKANGMFYITRLMDMNFTKLRNSKDIVLMFRKNKTDSWQEIDSEYKRDYIEAELKNGDYAFAIKTK